jgi:heme-degrading monooxygenase HmoA
MIIIQDSFVCKPGNASKLAKKCKEAFSDSPEVKYILTDMTGDFNRVIVVSEYESLSAYDKSWEEMPKDKEKMKKMEESMAGYTDMYLTGTREILRVW